jgi:hypothetical protein
MIHCVFQVKISSEDPFFSYISSRFSSDPESFDFLRFVRFEYLSDEFISDFISLIPDFNSIADHHLWEAISLRMISNFDPIDYHSYPGVKCPRKADKSVDGIIGYDRPNARWGPVRFRRRQLTFFD